MEHPFRIVIINFLICSTLILASCTFEDKTHKLPQFDITVDTNKINIGDYVDSYISYQSNNYSNNVSDLAIKIKYRGNTSSYHPKKNYSLKLTEQSCFIESRCHKRWKLNASYTDKTFMRNKLSYDLFRSFSSKNIAPRIEYVQVNINNNYNGIYSLTERIDSDLLSFNINDTNAVLFKEAPISFPTIEHNQRHIDFIAYSEWSEFYKGFSEKSMEKLIKRVYYNQRYPKFDKSNKSYLVHNLTDFIFNTTDSEFKNEQLFNSFFDLENLIDWHLLLLTTNNGDGLVKNFYLYRQGTNEPFKICPWDYDHSFGRDGGGELNLEEFISVEQAAILNRLLKTNAFNYRDKLLNKFMLLKKNDVLTSANIHSMIDKNVLVLDPFIKQNEEKWPLDNIAFFDKQSNFSSEITLMKDWVEKRLPKIEKYLLSIQLPTKSE